MLELAPITSLPYALGQSAIRSSFLATFSTEKKRSHDFLKAVRDAGNKWSHEQIASYIFAEVVPTAAHFSQTLAHVVNFYLRPDQTQARQEIVNLLGSQDKDAVGKVMAYVREALRESLVL